jgi:acyl dehydratase
VLTSRPSSPFRPITNRHPTVDDLIQSDTQVTPQRLLRGRNSQAFRIAQSWAVGQTSRTSVMGARHFEDFKTGDRFESATYPVSEEAIIAFAREFDPQSFHLDAATAKETMFEGLIASGWHTAAITMRLFVQTLDFAQGAIGLGVDELRWPNPVRPGDVLRVETEILDLRRSRSKPDCGIIRIRNVTQNQRGEIVQTMLASAIVPRRSGMRMDN